MRARPLPLALQMNVMLATAFVNRHIDLFSVDFFSFPLPLSPSIPSIRAFRLFYGTNERRTN